MSYDAECRRQFQEWLKAHYGTLDALNEHWSTAYWSQTYFDWSQIPLPAGPNNPGLMLAYKLFTTSVYRAYQCNLIDSIRRYAAPHQKITHNCLGFVAPLDYYDINADLDFASWDHYVGMGDPDLAIHSFESSLIRGLKRQNYWIMETQPGWVNWAKVNTAHHRGEVRAMAWHDVGHGADAVLYWQWRSAPNGQEQYHGNLIAPDGKPRPIYKEIAQIGREFESLRDVLAGTTLQADAAILHHYDSRWALEWQPHHYQFDAVKYAHSFYKPLREALHNVDVIHPKALLTGYKLVIAPMMHVLDDEITANLLRYVESGGHLVLGVRSGVKDVHNALLPMRQPGSALSSLLGAHVEEYYALLDAIPVEGAWSGQASIWAEWLEVDTQDAETLLRYGTANGWLDGQAALVTRRVGNGRITYMGAWFDDALMQYITGHLLEISEITPMIVPMPPGVELCRRTRQGSDTVSNTNNDHLYIVINHTSAPQEVQLSFPTRDLLTSNTHAGAISIPPRGVVVLQGNGS
jgi:beta-galactosidase